MIKSQAKELISALAESQAVDFSFIKKDGTLRKAIGSLKPELYLDNIPKGNGKERKGQGKERKGNARQGHEQGKGHDMTGNEMQYNAITMRMQWHDI